MCRYRKLINDEALPRVTVAKVKIILQQNNVFALFTGLIVPLNVSRTRLSLVSLARNNETFRPRDFPSMWEICYADEPLL